MVELVMVPVSLMGMEASAMLFSRQGICVRPGDRGSFDVSEMGRSTFTREADVHTPRTSLRVPLVAGKVMERIHTPYQQLSQHTSSHLPNTVTVQHCGRNEDCECSMAMRGACAM